MPTYLSLWSLWTADPEADEEIAGVPIPRQSNRRARSRSLAFQSNSSARERMTNIWTLSRGFSYYCKLFEMDTNSGRAIIAGPFSNCFRAKHDLPKAWRSDSQAPALAASIISTALFSICRGINLRHLAQRPRAYGGKDVSQCEPTGHGLRSTRSCERQHPVREPHIRSTHWNA